MDDGGVRFVIRVAANLARKAAARERQAPSHRAGGPPPNPFLPYEPALFVTDLTDTHLALLNQFNILDHHLLIVTRRFAHQETLLDEANCTALSLGMADHAGLGFYNGGAVAGASQPHKHLQWVPLPLVEFGPAVPIVPLLPAVRRAGEVGIVPGLPFRHAFVALDPALATQPRTFAETMHAGYRAALQAVGIAAVHRDGELWPSSSYNLLITREWLLLVPRRQEGEMGISINALGFAGSLFVRDQVQLALLRRRGPLAVLRAVTLPEPAA